jgi:hypothetical protein
VCTQCLRRKPCYLPGSGHCLTSPAVHPQHSLSLADTNVHEGSGTTAAVVGHMHAMYARQTTTCDRLGKTTKPLNMSSWLPWGLHGFAVPITATVTVICTLVDTLTGSNCGHRPRGLQTGALPRAAATSQTDGRWRLLPCQGLLGGGSSNHMM